MAVNCIVFVSRFQYLDRDLSTSKSWITELKSNQSTYAGISDILFSYIDGHEGFHLTFK